MSSRNSTQIYAIFHLNLAFSAIDDDEHETVIEKCYWPLLQLIDANGIPLGLELTAHTLEVIAQKAPAWVSKFRRLLSAGRCELLASGDSQIVGPLVPAQVNRHNLDIAQQCYRELLGVEPELAYINEQAVSSGLLDIYLDQGFNAVVVEWDNPYSHNPRWSQELLHRPQTLATAAGGAIKVIWNNAIAFQKLQRYAHREIILEDYLGYLDNTVDASFRSFSLYGSDAEVFDFRPGRYQSETIRQSHEWQRIATLFSHLQASARYLWCKPSETLVHWRASEPLAVATAAHPIAVKKQAKYNITRWGLSGKNDLLLNTLCHQRHNDTRQTDSENAWRKLCRLWASDLRTHLTETRYKRLMRQLSAPNKAPLPPLPAFSCHDDYQITFDDGRNQLHIQSPTIQLTLDTHRGLSIARLAFASHAFDAVCGTLSHGYFDHIRYGADFYSNHLVMERFRERDRITDLKPVDFHLHDDSGRLVIRSCINTAHGDLVKWYRLADEALQCGFEFCHDQRPEASLRLGFITLLDCDQRPWFACHNGGRAREYFAAQEDFDHGAPVSSIVSANSGLGATTGEVLFGSGDRGVALRWDPAQCAPMAMLSSKKINHEFLNRFWFSLVEADETLTAGGVLPDLCYSITPCAAPLAGVVE